MSSRLNRIIQNLRNPESMRCSIADLNWLCDVACDTFKNDPLVLRVDAPLCVIGDLHGQFLDLLKFLGMGGQPPKTSYLFLGDYVDRGDNSIETFAYLLALKVKYPRHIWMLRGNHETPDISRMYGFLDECRRCASEELFDRFAEVFRWLPLIAIISDRIFCVHGGLSQDLVDLKQIAATRRPLDIPDSGLLADLLWADPDNDQPGYAESERGTSYTFGPDVANAFLKEHDFDLICRAHQVVPNGFEFPFTPQHTVITLFSASNYCNDYGNKGAMMTVNANLRCSFSFVEAPPPPSAVLRPVTGMLKRGTDELPPPPRGRRRARTFDSVMTGRSHKLSDSRNGIRSK
jgi:serine/threonine-protein phosphatase PP1 catalytic subunit